jgi:hypothetical protein
MHEHAAFGLQPMDSRSLGLALRAIVAAGDQHSTTVVAPARIG